MLFGLALFLEQGIPGVKDLCFGAVAGLCGTSGLACLYSGLSKGNMGVVAPVAAVVSAVFPVIIGMILQGLPPLVQLAGFPLAILAVWFLSGGRTRTRMDAEQFKLAFAAGIGFGLFFIIISQVSDESILWPMISARAASIVIMFYVARLKKQICFPALGNLIPIVLAGVFDAGGNIFFVLASLNGRLDISVVVTSLYPAFTVILALMILKERLTKTQWAGFFLVTAALVLIARH